MSDIWSLINSQEIASYWSELASNRTPYVGEGLFPAKKRVGLDLSWIKGRGQLPVVLKPSAFDSKPALRDRGSVSLQKAEMPFFRESMQLPERDRQNLMSLSNASDELIAAAVSNLFDDAATLVSGALVVPEIMRFGVLQDAKFSIASGVDNVSYDYEYDSSSEWRVDHVVSNTAADSWDSGTTSYKVRDILAIKRLALRNGTKITRALVSPEVWSLLLEDPAIGHDIYPLAEQTYLGDSDLKGYLDRKTGITFSLYEKYYSTNDGVQYPFLRPGNIVFLPEGPVGQTFFGTTPEEADLMAGYSNAQVSIVETGIAVTTKVDPGPPVNYLTWVSEIVLPSFEGMDNVYVLRPSTSLEV
jgi:hypothetical protein